MAAEAVSGLHDPAPLRSGAAARWLDRLGASLADLLYPSECAVCRVPLSNGAGGLCGRCKDSLPHLRGAACGRCALPLGPAPSAAAPAQAWVCLDCRRNPPRFRQAVAGLAYIPPVCEMELRLKFAGEAHLAVPLGRILAETVRRAPFADAIDLVVPVPLHWKRHLGRRYNQAELLATVVARALGKPVARRVLVRSAERRPQARLPRAWRLRNADHAFRASTGGWTPPGLARRWPALARTIECLTGPAPAAEERIRGRTVLIVDDVLTTGATLSDCARALHVGGARAVYAATAARAIPRVNPLFPPRPRSAPARQEPGAPPQSGDESCSAAPAGTCWEDRPGWGASEGM